MHTSQPQLLIYILDINLSTIQGVQTADLFPSNFFFKQITSYLMTVYLFV